MIQFASYRFPLHTVLHYLADRRHACAGGVDDFPVLLVWTCLASPLRFPLICLYLLRSAQLVLQFQSRYDGLHYRSFQLSFARCVLLLCLTSFTFMPRSTCPPDSGFPWFSSVKPALVGFTHFYAGTTLPLPAFNVTDVLIPLLVSAGSCVLAPLPALPVPVSVYSTTQRVLTTPTFFGWLEP